MFDSSDIQDTTPANLPLQDLEREICELATHLAAATCRWLLLVAEWDERRAWAEWGVHSCAHWLSWRCSIGLVAAREHVRVGRRLHELPLVREAFSRGELSYSKVRAICRIASAATEEGLVRLALHATGAQMEKYARLYRRAQGVSLATVERAHERREVMWYWDDDGSLRAELRLPAEDGALFVKAVETFTERLRASDNREPQSPQSRGLAQRRADGLIELTRIAVDQKESTPRSIDRCELVVHVDAESLAADETVERSELEDGPALHPETVRRLGCDASVARIIERDGKPLSVGRRRRTISAPLRRALRSRDGGCRFPGCTHDRFLHAHHIQHWARGGPTNLDNLIQLCSYHHRLVHEGGFCVERSAAGSVRFRRPDGTLIPVAGRTRARGAGIIDAQRQRGLAVDGKTCMPRSAGQSLDYGIGVTVILQREILARERGP
jgi:Domain of unknown function (DUF222)/HNH endonuclease